MLAMLSGVLQHCGNREVHGALRHLRAVVGNSASCGKKQETIRETQRLTVMLRQKLMLVLLQQLSCEI
ncbi:hypothetical protein D3C85_1764470 [compost metagenome]